MMAFDKELRPDHRHPQTLRRGASSEGSLSPDGRSVFIFELFLRESTFKMEQTAVLFFDVVVIEFVTDVASVLFWGIKCFYSVMTVNEKILQENFAH